MYDYVQSVTKIVRQSLFTNYDELVFYTKINIRILFYGVFYNNYDLLSQTC